MHIPISFIAQIIYEYFITTVLSKASRLTTKNWRIICHHIQTNMLDLNRGITHEFWCQRSLHNWVWQSPLTTGSPAQRCTSHPHDDQPCPALRTTHTREYCSRFIEFKHKVSPSHLTLPPFRYFFAGNEQITCSYLVLKGNKVPLRCGKFHAFVYGIVWKFTKGPCKFIVNLLLRNKTNCILWFWAKNTQFMLG